MYLINWLTLLLVKKNIMTEKHDKKVKAIDVGTGKTISGLLDEMSHTGFQGKSLARVVDVFESMIKDKDLTIFFGYAGSLSTTGQWKIINWLIENRYIDVLIPTGANITEDIVEAMGFAYIQGISILQLFVINY